MCASIRYLAARYLAAFLLLVSCAAAGEHLQLQGEIAGPDAQPLPGSGMVRVDLFRVDSPFTATTLAMGSKFTFKNLEPGEYTIALRRPGGPEVRQTIDVVRAFADAKGRVVIKLTLDERNAVLTRAYTVSAPRLAVPAAAWQDLRKAQKDLSSAEPRKIEGGINQLQAIVGKYPKFVEALNLLGTIRYKRRELDQAEVLFRTALAADPNAYEPLVNLGGTLLDLNRPSEALPFNVLAVTLRPDDALACSQLGMDLFRLGHLENAERFLARAKKLDPGHFSHPQVMLAEIYLRQGRREDAVAELKEFMRLHPDDPLTPRIRANLPKLQSAQ